MRRNVTRATRIWMLAALLAPSVAWAQPKGGPKPTNPTPQPGSKPPVLGGPAAVPAPPPAAPQPVPTLPSSAPPPAAEPPLLPGEKEALKECKKYPANKRFKWELRGEVDLMM